MTLYNSCLCNLMANLCIWPFFFFSFNAIKRYGTQWKMEMLNDHRLHKIWNFLANAKHKNQIWRVWLFAFTFFFILNHKRRRFLIDIKLGDVISLPKCCMPYDYPLFRPPNPLLHLPTSCDNRIIKFFKDAFRNLKKICSRHVPILLNLYSWVIALCKIFARFHTWLRIKDITNFAIQYPYS